MIPPVSTNEREWQGDVLAWFNESLVLPFTSVTQETGVEGKFPDLIFWADRKTNTALAVCELKGSETPARDTELLITSNAKARNLGAELLVTWNIEETIVWKVTEIEFPEELWTYEPIAVQNTKRWRVKQKELRVRAHDLVVELAQFLRDGIPPTRGRPESTVFIESVRRTVEALVPLYQELMNEEFQKVVNWCATQTIRSDDNFETAARHAVYRTIGRILFYQTLARVRGDLTPISADPKLKPEQLQQQIQNHLKQARTIDWEAVFSDQYPDTLRFNGFVADRIRKFCNSFSPLNLPTMRLDIMGRIFESLIPHEDKKRLGQYFTEPWLGDLIVCCAIREKEDLVFDPTCGSGGILLRAYALLKRLGKDSHSELIESLWGNDIGHFPTELALINIFRQDLRDINSFPRILTKDIFELKPGMETTLPPNKTGKGVTGVKVEIPAFNAIVGNPPYLRRQDIGAGHRNPERYRNILWKNFPRYDHYSDLYVFVTEKAAEFLRPGGRLAFVTSNAWLDADYGIEVQKSFLENFKLVAVYESRCEPWFENADVNTVVFVLEKNTTKHLIMDRLLPSESSQHFVSFVKLKKPLIELIDRPLEDPRRYDTYKQIIAEVETAESDFEDDQKRVRKVSQQQLYSNFVDNAENSKVPKKWGIYLRAPDAFLQILDSGKVERLDRLIETKFGTLTGHNKFYCPREKDSGYQLFQKIHPKYRVPVLRSIKDCADYELTNQHCDGELFVCDDSLPRVAGADTKKYIDWGAKQSVDGVKLPLSGEMKNRTPWYSTRTPVIGDLVFQMFIGTRHCTPTNPKRFAVLNNVLAGDARQATHKLLARFIMNSTWFALCCELYGRINLGGGALKIEKADLDDMPLPNFNLFEKRHVKTMAAHFKRMLRREVLPVDEEVKQKDRRELDAVIFDILGIAESERSEIYAAVCQLAHDREFLAKVRKLRSSARTVRDLNIVVEDVMASAFPDGLMQFPDDFTSATQGWMKKKVPASGLQIVSAPVIPGHMDIFLGETTYKIEAVDGFTCELDSPAFVEYMHFAQNGIAREVPFPPTEAEAVSAVRSYKAYLEEISKTISKAVYNRVLSGRQAEQIVQKIWLDNNIPSLSVRLSPKRKARATVRP